jgi:hypothetical protein
MGDDFKESSALFKATVVARTAVTTNTRMAPGPDIQITVPVRTKIPAPMIFPRPIYAACHIVIFYGADSPARLPVVHHMTGI